MGIRAFIGRSRLERNPVSYWRKKGVKIGEQCEIYATTSFGSEPYLIRIGSHVRINSGVVFVTHDGGVWTVRDLYPEYSDIDLFGRITVGDNVHIGTNAIIMPGVTIGNNCIIGCGAIVTKDIPDNSVAAGIPARVIEDIDTYVKKNKEYFVHTKMFRKEEKRKFIESRY